MRNGVTPTAGLPEMLLQKCHRLPSQICACVNAESIHLLGGDWSYPMKLGNRQGLNKGRPHGRSHHELPVGLAIIRSQFSKELVVGNAGRCG
jgi:hypothetical protein